MNTPKLPIVILSSVFLLSACSSNIPTMEEQRISHQKSVGYSKQDIKKDNDLQLLVNKGGAIGAQAELDQYDISAKYPTFEKFAFSGFMNKRKNYLREKIKNYEKKELSKKDLTEREKNYKPRYQATDNDISSFLKYYKNVKHSISPYMYSSNKEAKFYQSYPSLKVTAAPPHKDSFIDFMTNGCKEVNRITVDDYSDGILENTAAKFFGVNLKISDVTMKCKRTPNEIKTTINFLKKIGIKENSKIIKEARKKDLVLKYKIKGEKQFAHPSIGIVKTGKALLKEASKPGSFSTSTENKPKPKNNYTDMKENSGSFRFTCTKGAKQKIYIKNGNWHTSIWSTRTQVFNWSDTGLKATEYSSHDIATKQCNY